MQGWHTASRVQVETPEIKKSLMTMKATDAIPILEEAIAKLESMEPSWKNCRACPHAGKCCDNAYINVVFPEEADAIGRHLRAHPEKLAYAEDRLSRGKSCYFHNPGANECLIHEVRPILCRWTPYTINTGDGSYAGMIRYGSCEFTPIESKDLVTPVTPGFLKVGPASGVVDSQIFLHLQGIKAMHPLLRRASEAIEMRDVMKRALGA